MFKLFFPLKFSGFRHDCYDIVIIVSYIPSSLIHLTWVLPLYWWIDVFFFKQTVLDLTIEHVLNCLEKLFGSDDTVQDHNVDSHNLESTTGKNRSSKKRKKTGKNQNSTKRRRLSLTNAGYPSNGGEKIHSYFIYYTYCSYNGMCCFDQMHATWAHCAK